RQGVSGKLGRNRRFDTESDRSRSTGTQADRALGEGGPALSFPPGERVPGLAARGLVGGGFEMSIVAYLRALTELGPTYVAITDGARGAFVASHKEIIFSPALESKIVGTAGAGDAFGATRTAYLALGYRLAEAVCAATAKSASVVGHVDTQTG